jgi:hypothetical protein
MYVVVCIIAIVVAVLLIVGVLFIAASSGFDQNVKH